MNSLVKTKKQVSTVMTIVMFVSIFVGGFSLPVLATNERIDQGSDVIIPLAAAQQPNPKKSGSKAAILGAVIAGSIVAISGLPMLTVAAGAAVGYAGVFLTKKAIGLFRGKTDDAKPLVALPALGVVDKAMAIAEEEKARCEEFIAEMNNKHDPNNQYQQHSAGTLSQSQSSTQRSSQGSSVSAKASYGSYEKAYKEYLAAVEAGDATLANEKFAEYEKCKEAFQNK